IRAFGLHHYLVTDTKETFPAAKRRHPRSPDVGQGVPTREDAATSRLALRVLADLRAGRGAGGGEDDERVARQGARLRLDDCQGDEYGGDDERSDGDRELIESVAIPEIVVEDGKDGQQQRNGAANGENGAKVTLLHSSPALYA